jgi:disulfide bond formation protein DsbB
MKKAHLLLIILSAASGIIYAEEGKPCGLCLYQKSWGMNVNIS